MKHLMLAALATSLSLLSAAPLAQTNEVSQTLSVFVDDNQLPTSYEALLKKHKLSGISFAVVDNYNIVYQHTAGVKTFGTEDKIDHQTSFSTASISKPITAIIAAMLVEQGKLDFDKPVSSYLKRWKMPSSQFTNSTPITLRHLFSHTAGTTQGGFADFYQGDDVPTLIESLNGVKLPRYKTPINVTFQPGTDWNYSGGGYVIAQVAIEDVTGKSLAELAQEMLFEPLGLTSTTMHQHGHGEFFTNVAKVHTFDQKVIGSGIPICPQIAPSGMWSNPTDMAKLVIDLQKALNGKPSKVISPFVAQQTTQLQTLHKVGGWAMGWMRYEGLANQQWFSHGGSNTGTGGHVMGTMEDGRGIMIFGNGPNPARIPVINKITDHIVSTMNWHTPLVAGKAVSPQLTAQISGRYLSPLEEVVTISVEQGQLTFDRLMQKNTPSVMQYRGNGHFAMDDFANLVSLAKHPTSGESYLYYSRQESDLKQPVMRKLAKGEKLPFEVAKTANPDETLRSYQAWLKQKPNSRMASAGSLNRAGYQALGKKDYKTALNFFITYTKLYPNDPNAFDSLAEAYMKKGAKQLAIKHYQKSLALNPNNNNAKEMISKLSS